MKKFFYRVKKEDTFFSVAKTFNVPCQTLITKNNLFREIEEGDVLMICQQPYCIASPFDSYYSLAQKLNLTEEYLKSQNFLFPYVFYGLIIKI